MSAPIEVLMSAKQCELFDALVSNARIAQARLALFTDTLFRGAGVSGVTNVQALDGKLVGEIPDPPKVAP